MHRVNRLESVSPSEGCKLASVHLGILISLGKFPLRFVLNLTPYFNVDTVTLIYMHDLFVCIINE